MESKLCLKALKVVSGLILLCQAVRCCDQAALTTCMTQYANAVSNCNPDGYNGCLSNAAYDQCTSLDQTIRTAIENLRGLQANCQQLSANLDDIPCLSGIQTCSNEMMNSSALMMSAIGGTPSEATNRLVCFCADRTSWIDEMLESFDVCLQTSLSECPAEMRSAMDQAMKQTKDQLKTMFTEDTDLNDVCDAAQSAGDCDCVKMIDKCVEDHLGSDFRQKQGQNPIPNYPACLNLGTKAQFKSAADCLQGLPEKCELRDLSIMLKGMGLSGAQPESPNDTPKRVLVPGMDIIMLRYICTEGCEHLNITEENTLQCMKDLGTDESLTSTEIKALQGQEKTDYCLKVQNVSACAVEKMSVCPIVLFTMMQLVNELKDGSAITSEQAESPIRFEMFSVCDVELIDYSPLRSDFESKEDPNGAPSQNSHSRKLTAVMVATVIALLLNVK